METLGIAPEIVAQMDFDADENDPQAVAALIGQMDALLGEDERLRVMERQGCCKTGLRDKRCRAFFAEHGDKPLAEKLRLLAEVPYMMAPRLSDEGDVVVTFGGYQNGLHEGATTCSCGLIKKLRQPFCVSRTYCGCCAGHFLHHYQRALGVRLRLKAILSSPLDTNGAEPCSFAFEVLDGKADARRA